jgi:hypothetical protein
VLDYLRRRELTERGHRRARRQRLHDHRGTLDRSPHACAGRGNRLRRPVSFASAFSSLWISALNGSSFDTRDGREYLGAVVERNAARIVAP